MEKLNRQSFSNLLNVETVTQSRGVIKPLKDRLIHSIKKEIELVEKRDDLQIKLLSNNKKENRFWIIDKTNPNKLLVNIKLKGKIFNFGEEYDSANPPYFQIDNNKESLIDFLKVMMDKLNGVDYNQKGFWVLNTNKPIKA